MAPVSRRFRHDSTAVVQLTDVGEASIVRQLLRFSTISCERCHFERFEFVGFNPRLLTADCDWYGHYESKIFVFLFHAISVDQGLSDTAKHLVQNIVSSGFDDSPFVGVCP